LAARPPHGRLRRWCGVAHATPAVSVVVPTRDRPRALARCLEALERQRFDAELEVVVVDDGSTEATEVADAVVRAPHARLLRLNGSGPAAARNHGARSARGSLILFTDDDCEPEPVWAARLAAALLGGADAAGGNTVNGNEQSALAEASQAIADHLVETSRRLPARAPFATSNNLACRADVFAAVPFDERYRSPGGEDRDWCVRLAEHGFLLKFEPTAIVVHRHELSLRDFWRQHVAYGRGAYRFRERRSSERRNEAWPFYTGLVRRGFQRGAAVGAMVCVAQVATSVGFLGEARRRG
jgi:glycosyltransferase involved in cell wall biosynthesis